MTLSPTELRDLFGNIVGTRIVGIFEYRDDDHNGGLNPYITLVTRNDAGEHCTTIVYSDPEANGPGWLHTSPGTCFGHTPP